MGIYFVAINYSLNQQHFSSVIISFAAVLWVITQRSCHERCVTTPKTAAWLRSHRPRRIFNRLKIRAFRCSVHTRPP